MKKLLLLFTVLLGICTIQVNAQNIAVQSFELSSTDLTANTPGTMVKDQNGNLCALIKMETTHDGFTFDVGMLAVSEVKRVGGELWIYVPYGIRKMTISHPQFGVLRDYSLPCAIEKGRTYVMKVTAGTVKTIVEYDVSKQFLFVQLDPADAMLQIDGKIKATSNGTYQELLSFGRYSYVAQRLNYHDAEGVIDISDPNNTHRLNIKLKPAFGHVSVSAGSQSDAKGAAVYIDDKPVGEIPLQNIQLNSGSHQIRIIKPMYEVYTATFTVSDEENKVITPSLIPDFAEVTLKSGSNSDIYVNGEKKGKGSWIGRLPTGSYIFESRQSGHISTKMTYEISRHDQSKTIMIQEPIPIYGSLIVSSTPANARVSIGGSYVGETPKYIGKQVIGDYTVKVEMDGYVAQSKTVTVSEGNESSLNFELVKSTSVAVSSSSYSSSTASQSVADIKNSSTANCYIISKSGTYNFPTVKGNSNVSVGNVASAEVVWETFGTLTAPNIGDLIQSVSYSNGYITFTTPSYYREGNALIAAKDANGTILWSWHIWLTDQPAEQVYYNNAGTMMDRNLGATSASIGDPLSNGLLYQWGRKDPFLGSATINDYGTAAKSTITLPSSVKSDRNHGTIDYAISHPATFITKGSNGDWYYTTSSTTTDKTRWTTSDKTKSIYDPCPAGWRVPDGGDNGVWAVASSGKSAPRAIKQNNAQVEQGMNMSKVFGSDSIIWYPFAGYRDEEYDSIFRAAGYYWSATTDEYVKLEANRLAINTTDDGKMYPVSYEKRAKGSAVRCIKE